MSTVVDIARSGIKDVRQKRCFLTPETPPCFVQLGRHGDVMIMLPAALEHYRKTGVKPVFMACKPFSDTLEGCNYIQPFPVWDIAWNSGLRRAYEYAIRLYDKVYVPKWWDCAGMEPPPPPQNEPRVELDYRGRRIIVSQSEWDSYQYSQWKACGFTRQQLLDWPLVFDNRSKERESLLIKNHVHGPNPIVLYNFTGVSNPMGWGNEVLRWVWPFRSGIQVIDLGSVRAERIYDLLGLYDRALCLITGDTATLHLAAASAIPVVALLADGGAGSIVKGNDVLKIRYNDIPKRGKEIADVIQLLLMKHYERNMLLQKTIVAA